MKSLKESFDLETTCGYVTLLNIAARKRKNLRKMPNITTLASDTFDLEECEDDEGITLKAEVPKSNDVGTRNGDDHHSNGNINKENEDVSNCDKTINENLENLSNGIMTMKSNGNVFNESNGSLETFETPPLSPVRHKITSSSSMDHLMIDDQWVVLHVSYGLPLFDNTLNSEICSKVREQFSIQLS